MLYVVKRPVYQLVLVDADCPEDAITRVTREGEGIYAGINEHSEYLDPTLTTAHEAHLEQHTVKFSV